MEDNKSRKKFKDTKVGKFIKDKAPEVLDVVGDLLPDNGVLGVAKNLINMSDKLTDQDKEQLNQMLLEEFKLEVDDRKSAREMAIEKAKMGYHDPLFYATGLFGLLAFGFIIYAIAFLTIPEENKDLWIHLIGITEGVVLSIFAYYYGASMRRGSK